MMKSVPLAAVICICTYWCGAQTDSVMLPQVVVTSYRDEPPQQTSLHIQTLSSDEMEQSGAFNLTDAMAKQPGISQLSTGVAISKPVIRGLYGNRVLVLLSGLRFDNQQWQDEHGLGLSDIGIERLEIIKGPFSLLYGTEAVAGVINVIEEEKPTAGTSACDAGLKFNTNTLGAMMQFGIKANTGSHWYRLRVGAESNADYSDGNGDRVLNSRFDGYYAKGTYGWIRGKWKSENNYDFSLNRYGFIFGDVYDFFDKPDARWSRDFPGPHHIVILNIASSQNTLYLHDSEIKLNAGVQSNQRLEDEGSSISLNMHLITGEYTLRWIKPLSDKTELVLANITSVEKNTNYGKRKIVPDAWMNETGISAFIKHNFGASVLEAGGGAGVRYIKTLLTPGVNSDEKEIDPFTTTRPFINGLAGISLNPSALLNIKINCATGVRSPNLAELSSNGLHEGIFTFEIGDPDLQNEMNFNSGIDINFNGTVIQFNASVFYNHFNNYIYLAPTDEEWFGFPIYRYRQQDADLYGSEAELSCTPGLMKGVAIGVTGSGMRATTADGNYLPFIPADKITPSIRYAFREGEKMQATYIFISDDFVFEQSRVAPEEIATGAYQLLNAGFGCTIQTNSFPLEFSVAGNNLLNREYYDHLFRFKTLGLLNIGTNITINCKILFSQPLKAK